MIQVFLETVFLTESIRRQVMFSWHEKHPGAKQRALSWVFAHFIRTILYAHVDVHFMRDHIRLFGEDFPIHMSVLPTSVQEHIRDNIWAHKERYFAKIKEHNHMTFDYTDPIEDVVIETVWRRTVVRDFVWLVCQTRDMFLHSQILLAVQRVNVERDFADVYVSHLHHVLQSPYAPLREIMCWGLAAHDKHPEETRNASH